ATHVAAERSIASNAAGRASLPTSSGRPLDAPAESGGAAAARVHAACTGLVPRGARGRPARPLVTGFAEWRGQQRAANRSLATVAYLLGRPGRQPVVQGC